MGLFVYSTNVVRNCKIPSNKSTTDSQNIMRYLLYSFILLIASCHTKSNQTDSGSLTDTLQTSNIAEPNQHLKKLGVTYYETFVTDGHTDYYGANDHKTSSTAKYDALRIAETSNPNSLKMT
jgi:hypothetical protein